MDDICTAQGLQLGLRPSFVSHIAAREGKRGSLFTFFALPVWARQHSPSFGLLVCRHKDLKDRNSSIHRSDIDENRHVPPSSSRIFSFDLLA